MGCCYSNIILGVGGYPGGAVRTVARTIKDGDETYGSSCTLRLIMANWSTRSEYRFMGMYCSADQIILNHKDLPIMFQAFVIKCVYSDVWINAHYLTILLRKTRVRAIVEFVTLDI